MARKRIAILASWQRSYSNRICPGSNDKGEGEMNRDGVWEETREILAAIEHSQWTHWTAYFLRTLLADHPELSTDPNIIRWSRQILTDYDELSEKEKESDRKWVEKVMHAMRDLIEFP